MKSPTNKFSGRNYLHLSSLSDGDRKGFVKAFKWGIKDWKTVNVKEFQGDEAKTTFYISAASSWDKSKAVAIWFGVLFVIRKLHRAFLKEKTNQQEIAELRELDLSVRKMNSTHREFAHIREVKA